MVYIELEKDYITHSNILIFDFKNKTCERFELVGIPYNTNTNNTNTE